MFLISDLDITTCLTYMCQIACFAFKAAYSVCFVCVLLFVVVIIMLISMLLARKVIYRLVCLNKLVTFLIRGLSYAKETQFSFVTSACCVVVLVVSYVLSYSSVCRWFVMGNRRLFLPQSK